jgi:hypothetical protein
MSDTPTNPETPIPSDAGVVATLGIQPQSIVVKALEGAKDALVAYLGRPDVERELAGGIFAFVNAQFPIIAGNPIAQGVEEFLLKLIANRSTPTP